MLPRTDCGLESYRFLWLRTFHKPIAVRVWSADSRYYLVVKELSGQGGYEPGRIIVSGLDLYLKLNGTISGAFYHRFRFGIFLLKNQGYKILMAALLSAGTVPNG